MTDAAHITSASHGSAEVATAFDGYEVLANPLGGFSNADRERRVFGRDPATGHGGTCYGSHVVQLAKRESDGAKDPRLFILVEHGGGREVWLYRLPYDRGNTLAGLLAMPEAALYGILYGAAKMARAAREQAQSETATEWREASRDGRIRRRSYPSRGVCKIWIEPARRDGETEESHAMRCRFAAPGRA